MFSDEEILQNNICHTLPTEKIVLKSKLSKNEIFDILDGLENRNVKNLESTLKQACELEDLGTEFPQTHFHSSYERNRKIYSISAKELEERRRYQQLQHAAEIKRLKQKQKEERMKARAEYSRKVKKYQEQQASLFGSNNETE